MITGEKPKDEILEIIATAEADHVALEAINPQIAAACKQLLEEFKDVAPEALPAGLPPSRGHELKIEIKPGSRIPHKTAHRLNLKHKQYEDKWLADMLSKSLIRKSQSEYAAPHFYVEKPDTAKTGEYRAVTDYRALNEITVRNRYPLPRVDELIDQLAGAQWFSKIDLKTGFYQILIREEDRHKTAFITSQGLFEYNVLPMGLCNSPGIFMQLMNDIFREAGYLNKFVVAYLDDIVIYSKTKEEHEQHLRQVFKVLRRHKLFVKGSKCELFKEEVQFLGHYVGRKGVRVMDDKIDAVTNWPVPQSLTELRAFLGLAGYYRRFVKDYSKIILPLSDLVKTTTGTTFRDSWGEKQMEAFKAIKEKLQKTPILAIADFEKPFVVHTDASGYAVGAVLQQDLGHGLQPIAYLSKKMKAAETRYPVHEQELLAIVTALETWRHYLQGAAHRITIRTDHKSLVHFQSQPMLSGRQARWLETLSAFDYNIEYIKGEENIAADAFSRRSDHDSAEAPIGRELQIVDRHGKRKVENTYKIFKLTSEELLEVICAVEEESNAVRRRIELDREKER
jgi:hypothetical protein